MADREVLVRLRLDISQYQREAAAAAAETKVLGRETDKLGGSGGGLAKTEAQSKRTGSEIDKLSGRLRVMADAAVIGAPALTAFGAAGVGAMVAFATQLGVTAGALGVTVLAVKGLGDGLKALDTYQSDKTPENFKKLREEMEKLGPAGEEFVRFIDSIEPNLKTLQNAAREGLLPGAEKGIDALLGRLPELRKIIRQTATELGDLSAGGGEAIAGPKFDAFFEYLRKDGIPILDDTAKTAGNLAEVVANLFVGFGGVSQNFSGGLLKFSQGLADASENLDTNKGFQDFLSYIQTEGPHALETIESIANAMLQIVEAAAPLGGPVLTAVKAFADAIAAIADSDLGSPIFAGLAALALYNRALSLTGSLNKTAWGASAISSMKSFRGSLLEVTSAQDRARLSAQELADVEATRAGNIRGGLATFGKGAAVIGGLTLATSGLAEQTGLSNAASLAMAGSIAGPWGAAIGGGVGLAMDFAHANDNLNDSLANLDVAKASGDLATFAASISTARDELDKMEVGHDKDGFMSGFLGGFHGLSEVPNVWSKITGATGDAADQIDKAQAAYDKLAAAQQASSDAAHAAENPMVRIRQVTEAAAEADREQANALIAAVDAMKGKRQEALRAVDAELNYQSAILDANGALKENGKDFSKTTEAGIANRKLVYGLADAWNQQSDAAKNAKGSLADARKNFIQTAEDLGSTAKEAKNLADRLFEIPPKRRTEVGLDGVDNAINKAQGLKAMLDQLHSKDINIALHYQTIGNKPRAPIPGESALGGTVPKSGLGYADRYPYMLADGEEVISNRSGQADRHRGLLKAINAGRLAGGGTAGRASGRPDTGGLDRPLFTGEGPRFYKAAYKHNRPFAVAPLDPSWPYQSGMTDALNRGFEKWVNDWQIPFDMRAKLVDYDMRGFYKAERPQSWAEGQHFPDTWKTPYDTTFSHESKYATKDNPFYWKGNTLVDIRNGQIIFGASDGATVPKTGLGYADRHPYMLADGEEVISNRFGQADRHRSLLKNINAGRMADGGTAGDDGSDTDKDGKKKKPKQHVTLFTTLEIANLLDGAHGAAQALKILQNQLKKSEKSLDKERQARDDAQAARDQFASTVGGAFSPLDPFATASTSPWADSANPLSGFDSAVAGNTNTTNAANSALATAAGNGLDGPLYQALASSGNLALVQAFAGLSAADIGTREQQFAGQSNAQSALGSSAAAAAGFTAQLAGANDRLDKVVDQVKELRQDVKQASKDNVKGHKDNAVATGQWINGAASNGHRRRH